ncbi:MAG: hypothetical protein JKY96_08750 [Phycisphaerales bacterium]|nr:hypothetical protein [Phycisphaerales bacterium]
MDDRQTEISQGEGLNESRVNQEFVDFLNKWSSPVLMVLAIAALTYAGMQWMQKKKIEKINSAFSNLEAVRAGDNPSPASLKTLANEYKGVRAVPELALLQTTDIFLRAFVSGIEPGADLDPLTGLPRDENEMLDETQRTAYLDQAGQLAQQVIDLTAGKDSKAILAIQARIRMAVVKESKRDFDGAKLLYTGAAKIASDNGYPILASFAEQRAEGTGSLNDVPALPSDDQLVGLPGEERISQDIIDQIMNSSLPTIESDPQVIDTPVDESPEIETQPEATPEAIPETTPQAEPEDEPAADPETDPEPAATP